MSDDRKEGLDALLATPLCDVADDGFSARVVARAREIETRRERLATLVPALGICALVPFLPLRELADAVARLTPMLAGSGAVALALAALILTFSLEQRLQE